MVFLHGTSIMHGSAAGLPRARRVRQVTSKDRAVLDDGASVPTEMREHRRHGQDDRLGAGSFIRPGGALRRRS